VLKLAHDGDQPLFSLLEAKTADANSIRLRIQQEERADRRSKSDVVILDIHVDGTLSLLMNITGLHVQDHDSIMGGLDYFIDPDDVQKRLQQAWGFAAKFWQYRDPYARYAEMLYNVVIRELGFHRFEKAPQDRRSAFAILNLNPPKQLLVYSSPELVVRAEIFNPTAQISETLDMLQLRFREMETN
jgi:hypothetical protein